MCVVSLQKFCLTHTTGNKSYEVSWHLIPWCSSKSELLIGLKTMCIGGAHSHGCVYDSVFRDDHVTRVE